ncbi:MAG: LicD family protein [Bacteroidaceae bacterium]|nr:LicD family protein [Bacteroidaceae bacterium]
MTNKYFEEFKKTQLRKCQLKQLAILEVIDSICRKHNIEYWLDGGTLLGAVRHKGFIPWDDDIDVAMKESEMERFVKIAPSELPENLRLELPEKVNPILKLRDLNSFYLEPGDDLKADYHKGVYVDFFQFVDYPNVSRKFVKKHVRQIGRSWSILHKQHTYSLRSFVEFFYFNFKYCYNLTLWKLACMLFKKGRYFSNVPMLNGYGIMHDNKCLYPLTEVEFEGKRFPAPADSDCYLREIYGNYMEIPPKEKQKIHSYFILSELMTNHK